MSIRKCCISILVMYLLLCSLFSFTPVNAASNATIQPYSYYDIGSFSFTGTSKSVITNYDGTFMAIEATATSASGKAYDVTLHVTIYGRNVTNTYTLSSNGTMKKFDYIYLGLSSSTDVSIYCTCNSSEKITINLKTYSWL